MGVNTQNILQTENLWVAATRSQRLAHGRYRIACDKQLHDGLLDANTSSLTLPS